MLDRRTARLDSAAEVDLSTSIAGRPSSLPFGISPTGFARFMHSEGEDAGAPAAAKAGILFSLSPMDTRSVKEVARVPAVSLERPRGIQGLVGACAKRLHPLLVAVETPVAGQRLRDTRNGMTIPPQLTAKIVLAASYRPA